jgi:hypothetical protein
MIARRSRWLAGVILESWWECDGDNAVAFGSAAS